MTVVDPRSLRRIKWHGALAWTRSYFLLTFATNVLFLAASVSAQTVAASQGHSSHRETHRLRPGTSRRGLHGRAQAVRDRSLAQARPPRAAGRGASTATPRRGTFCALLKVSTLRPPIPRDATMGAVLSCIEAILDGRWDEAAATEDVTARIQRTRHVPTELEMELRRQAVRQAVMRFSQDAGACTADGWFEADDTWKLADNCFRSTVAELRRAAAPR